MSLKNACMLPLGLLLLAASPALARKWTDNTGKYSVEAEFVEVKADDVLLKKPDGSIIPVPIGRLSDADRRYLEHLKKQTGETQGRLKHRRLCVPQETLRRKIVRSGTAPCGSCFTHHNLRSEITCLISSRPTWSHLVGQSSDRLRWDWGSSSPSSSLNFRRARSMSGS